MGTLGDNDEEEAESRSRRESQGAARRYAGRRDEKGAKPLVASTSSPGLEGRRDHRRGSPKLRRQDRGRGQEHRLWDEGPPGLRDRGLGGFFTPGKDSIVVPIRFLKVSQERDSFFLPMPEAQVKTIPPCPTRTTSGCPMTRGAPERRPFLAPVRRNATRAMRWA